MPIRFAAATAAVAAASLQLAAETVTFTEDTEVFRNPGQGWAALTKWQLTKIDQDVNLGQLYTRTTWASLEPGEGKYNWSEFDDMLKVAEEQGIPFSFRIMCAWMSSKALATPQWVFDKGAKGDKIAIPHVEKGATNYVTQISPHFDDPVFMAEHKRFISALAQRYDGNPLIAGIDIGSYGHWGEWHCHGLPPDTNRYMIAVPPKERPNTQPIKYPADMRRQYAEWYIDSFKKTPLVFMTDDDDILKFAVGDEGPSRVGLRRDGVGSPWHAKRWLDTPPYNAIPKLVDAWKERPIWFEFFGPATMMLHNRWDVPGAIDWMLTNHVSVVNTIPFAPWDLKKSDPANYALLKKLDLYAGARLVPRKGAVVRKGQLVGIGLLGTNRGATRIYLPYVLQAVVSGPDGRELYVHDCKTDPGSILPGPFRIVENFTLPAEADVDGAKVSLRLRHRYGVLMNFRFAATESAQDRSLPLGQLPRP